MYQIHGLGLNPTNGRKNLNPRMSTVIPFARVRRLPHWNRPLETTNVRENKDRYETGGLGRGNDGRDSGRVSRTRRKAAGTSAEFEGFSGSARRQRQSTIQDGIGEFRG